MKFTLAARQPFNFLSVVNSHGWVQLAPFHFDPATNTLHHILQLANGHAIELKLRESQDGLNVETEKLDKTERKEVADKVAWMFGLDMDFSRFYKASRSELKLKRAKQRSLGRVLRSPTVFEDVLKTILTTNTLWAATKNMTRKLVDRFGAPLPTEAEKRAFPTPESIAASSPEVLKESIRVGYRAPAIHQLAVRVASGQLDLESLKTSSMPTLDLRKHLMSINGIGPYAAANLLMILGRHDFIPIDSYALKMVSHEWHDGQPVTTRDVENHFQKWGEFKGLAFWFWDWTFRG